MVVLKAKKIIVTGGSRGIGKSIVETLANAGATLAFSYAKNKTSAEDVLKNLPGENHFCFELDIRDSKNTEAAIQLAIERLGGLDGIVNNAGITKDQILLRMKDEDFQDVIATNLNGTYYCTKAVLKTMMKQRNGSIVNLSSVIGTTGNAGQANYAASKAGIEAFTRSVALEMASRNIRANSVAPGFIQTEMTDALTDDQKQKIITQIPLGRIASPDEVAQVVAFLLSDGANYITGQTIHVNGGMRM
ncbi:MAG: 3-oxoacyl-[acyl-carrier-protein] reductase [Bdellovibrionales bacterium]|nr:3-oxoacyl-[acyl-carrier-protein] reductase [Bdellovibrionales bacterium]